MTDEKSMEGAKKSGKGRGRPRANTKAVMVRLPERMISKLEAVSAKQVDTPSTPEMIRRILKKELGDD